MSELLIQQEPAIKIQRNTNPEVWCSYCKERWGSYWDKELKKAIWYPQAQRMAYWVIQSIHPDRKQEYSDKQGNKYISGRSRAYCLDCLNEIESDGYSLQEQLIFGATYTHELSTGGA